MKGSLLNKNASKKSSRNAIVELFLNLLCFYLINIKILEVWRSFMGH